jgi:hypothetical protein
MRSHARFANQHAYRLTVLILALRCACVAEVVMRLGRGYLKQRMTRLKTLLKSALSAGTFASHKMDLPRSKTPILEGKQMMKFVLMAENRGRESLKSVHTDPNFPPRIEVDPRSHEAKIVVTNKVTNHSSERTLSMRILMEAPQPTVIHSLSISYQQCMRELQWK